MVKGVTPLIKTAPQQCEHTFETPHLDTFPQNLQNPKDKLRISGTTREERKKCLQTLTIRPIISKNRDQREVNSRFLH